MWPFKENASPPAPPPIDEETFKLVAKAPVFNPNDSQQISFAMYRADAIAREIVQRAAEGRDLHQDHDKMVAEALSYAWMLVGTGKWTKEELRQFEARIKA